MLQSLTDLPAKFQSLGLEVRTAQLDMMQVIESTLKKSSIAVIEGGTGIGKTFGYLIPTLLAKTEEFKIVLATATVNLQMQLIEKDLPWVSKILGREIRAEMAKGRRRYVCISRLFSANTGIAESGQLNLLGIEVDSDKAVHLEHQQEMLDSLIEEMDQGWDGDRDVLKTKVSEPFWQKVSTDASGCSGRRCAYIRECPFFKARGKLKSADIIVANHDVLLSDLVMGSGTLLPESSETFYIIDEAHHFPVKALEHFASATSLKGAKQWLSKMNVMVQRLRMVLPDLSDSLKAFEENRHRMQETLTHLYEALWPQMQSMSPTQDWVLSGENSGEQLGSLEISPVLSLIQRLLSDAHPLQNLLYCFRKSLSESQSDKTLPDFDPLLQALGFLIQKNHTLIRTWEMWISANATSVSPIAKWISKSELDDLYIHAAYTSADRVLPQFFWNQRTRGIVLCSATLRSLGSFDSFLSKSGLKTDQRVSCHAFLSPFDYAKSILKIPMMQWDPTYENNEAYLVELAEYIQTILKQETQGSLVLFTSKKTMESVYENLSLMLKNLVLMQGLESKSQLLKQHKDRIDAGVPSVIFGLQSFAEGIDLPGNYCRHVIITKLPFSVPSTPIEQTFVHWMRLREEDPFLNHTLPEASLRLNQFAGRLIRHEKDTGTLSILDNRILKKRYGKSLIRALPAFSRD